LGGYGVIEGQIVLLAVVIYGGIITFLGLYAKKFELRTAEDYFIASRSIGGVVLAFTMALSVMSGLAYYGYPASMYREGIGIFAGTGGFIAGLMFAIFGSKLWKLGKLYGFITPSDFLEDRFYSHFYGTFVAILMIIGIIPYMALQIKVMGVGINVVTRGYISFEGGILLMTFFIALHIILGGMRSIAWHDTFHGILGILILFTLIGWIIFHQFPGGLVQATNIVLVEKPSVLGHPGPRGTFTWSGTLAYALTGAVATFVWPHIIIRSFAAKSKEVFKINAVLIPLIYVLVFSCLLIIGVILGPALFGGKLTDMQSEEIVPMMFREYTPLWLAILGLVGLLAFAGSTADSFALVGSSIITKDVLQKNIKRRISENKAVAFGRFFVLVIMILAGCIAATSPAFFITFGYDFASPAFAQILPAVIFSLYWKRATKEGALAGTMTGAIIVILTLHSPFGIHPIIWSLAFNVLVFIIVSFMTKPPSKDIISRFFDPFIISKS
jgi:SSS family solute:Na+ symporter